MLHNQGSRFFWGAGEFKYATQVCHLAQFLQMCCTCSKAAATRGCTGCKQGKFIAGRERSLVRRALQSRNSSRYLISVGRVKGAAVTAITYTCWENIKQLTGKEWHKTDLDWDRVHVNGKQKQGKKSFRKGVVRLGVFPTVSYPCSKIDLFRNILFQPVLGKNAFISTNEN